MLVEFFNPRLQFVDLHRPASFTASAAMGLSRMACVACINRTPLVRLISIVSGLTLPADISLTRWLMA
jgi:hypothetical protein